MPLLDQTATARIEATGSAFQTATAGIAAVPSPPPGFSLALTAGPLTDDPAWTRVDSLSGVKIESIEVERGRPTEWDKTAPGVVTIRGVDTEGALDPTNPGSPLAPYLVPVKQAALTIKNAHTGEWKWLFRGHVSYIRNTPDASKNWQEFEIQLVDMLDILNDEEVIPDFAGNRVPTESMGDTFYTGQHVDDRILAVLADASTAFMRKVWPVSKLQVASGNVNVQGTVYSRGTSLLRVVDEACDAEFPDATNRFITVDGAFAFRGRGYRFVPTHHIPLDNSTRVSNRRMLHWSVGDMQAFQGGAGDRLAVPTTMSYKIDKADLVNAVLVTAKGVSDATLAGGTLFASDSGSVDAYGPRTGGRSIEGLILGDADDGNNPDQESATYAQAIVENYKDPCVYVDTITFKNPVADGTDRYANNWRILTEVELSDLLTYYSTHAGGGGFTTDTGVEQDHYVESIKYSITALQGDEWNVQLVLGLSSRHHYRWLSAEWTTLRAGDGSTTLAASFTAMADTADNTVVFYDLSVPGPSGPITDWLWDFGDGTTATMQFPTRTYDAPGTYSVNLTVTSSDGTDNLTIPVTVPSAD